MKVLVVGGTGVIGSPVVKALVRDGHTVRATARGSEKAALVRNAGADPVDIDVYDVEQLRKAMRGCDAVMRMTTKISPAFAKMRSPAAWEETNRLRTVGAHRIVDAALAENVGVYVTESFYAVYADAGDSVVDERMRTEIGGIKTLKAALDGEKEAERFSREGGRGVALRFGGYYSPNAPSTRETIAMLRKRALPFIGPMRFYFPSIHLDDAARAAAQALQAPAGTYNVCDDEPVRWEEMVSSLVQVLNAKPPLRLPAFLGPALVGYPWKYMTRSVRMSNARFKAATGWEPAVRSVIDGWPSVVEALSSSEPTRRGGVYPG